MTAHSEDIKDEKHAGKKPYKEPKLERHGAVEDLTLLTPLTPAVDTSIVLGSK